MREGFEKPRILSKNKETGIFKPLEKQQMIILKEGFKLLLMQILGGRTIL